MAKEKTSIVDVEKPTSHYQLEVNVVDYVKERLTYLHRLKSHRFPKYWKYRNEYNQNDVEENTEDGFTNYAMNTGFAIVNAKVSEIFANTPQYDFVGLDEDGRKYKRMVEKMWEWIWKHSGTNKSITQIIRDSCKYGTGFGIERFVKKKRDVKSPSLKDDGTIEFISKEVVDYEGCELSPIDWGSVYINGRDIDNTTEAIIISHWDKDEFFNYFGNNNMFSFNVNNIVPGKRYYVNTYGNELVVDNSTSRDGDNSDNDNTISVIEYWNKYKDEYVIIANDIHINPYLGGIMPNPNPHKDIPIVVYIDHHIDGDAYGRGEFDITEKSRDLKNETRSLEVETIKMQGGIITIDPSSDFDETVERIGLKQFARVAKEDFGFFAPAVNISSLELLEKKIDEDIIIETGVDFRGQLFGPNETAERSKGRTESARKRINSNIRENAYTFYERLARLRISNIKTYYKGKDTTIPVKGFSITEDGVQESLTGDYGVMKVTEKMLSGAIMLIPVVDSIYGDTSKQQKQKYLEMFQLLLNLRKADGTPLIEPQVLLEAGRGIIDDVIDLDKILGGNAGVEAEINRKLKERGLPSPTDTQAPPGGIPPAQQSGKPILLPSASSNLSEGT